MEWLFRAEPWPETSLRLRLRREVTIEAAGGVLVLRHWWGSTNLNGVGASTAARLRRLAHGWVASTELASASETDSGADPLRAITDFAEVLWALDRIGFLVALQLVHRGEAVLTLEPLSRAAHLPAAPVHPSAARLSPFAFLQDVEDDLVVLSAVGSHRAVVHSAGVAAITSLLGPPAAPGDHVTAATHALLGAVGMLRGSEGLGSSGIADSTMAMAEFPDLLMHQRSRYGRFDGEFGAAFPFRDVLPPPDPLPPLPDTDLIPLPRPDVVTVRERDPQLTDALESRVSLRQFADRPVTLAELGEFLFRCARTRGCYGPMEQHGLPYVALDRPYPSGGGLHDLEIYLVCSRVDGGLSPGVYHYRTERHALHRIGPVGEAGAAVLAAALRASLASMPPPVLVKVTSRFARVAWKYRSMGYPTTLKNVGVLYQTMYLVANAMGLAGCALGSGDEVAGPELLGPAAADQLGIGEFMLGHPQHPLAAVHMARQRRLLPTWHDVVDPGWALSGEPGETRGAP